MFKVFSKKKYDATIDITLKTGEGEPFKLKNIFQTEVWLYRDGNEFLGQMLTGDKEFSSSTEYAVDMGRLSDYFSSAANKLSFYLNKNGFIEELENAPEISSTLHKRLSEMDSDKKFAPQVRTSFKKAFNKPQSDFKKSALKTGFYYFVMPPILNTSHLKINEPELVGRFNCNTKLVRYPDRRGTMPVSFKVYRELIGKDEKGSEIKISFLPSIDQRELNLAKEAYLRLFNTAENTPFKFEYAMYFICRLNMKGELEKNTGYIKEQLSENVYCEYVFSLTPKEEINTVQKNLIVDPAIKPTRTWSVFDGIDDPHK